MTDTRLKESFLTHPEIVSLTSDTYRVYVNGMVWSTTHGQDGIVLPIALALLHPDGRRDDLVAELVKAGLWMSRGTGWEIRHFLDYQESAETIRADKEAAARRRLAERDKKRNQRSKQPKPATSPYPSPGTPDGDSPPGTHQGTLRTETRQGQEQAATGEDQLLGASHPNGQHDPWTSNSENIR